MGYLVDADELAGLAGSAERIEELIAESADDIADFDEELRDDVDESGDGGQPTLVEALRAIPGGDLDDEHGVVYAAAYRVLVEALGTQLIEGHLSPLPGGKAGVLELSTALRDAGVTGQLPDGFTVYEPEIDLPAPDDYPTVVTLSAEQCAKAAQEYEAALPTLAVEPRLRAAAQDLIVWFRTARDADRDLIIFFG
ncbi:hypothetical protein Acsp01_77070 [Actinoplanes sp. NBRC 101535]|nr:hypothetical protein Acsp01_77070 [Actinoplanes sp. NBRC 101535]